MNCGRAARRERAAVVPSASTSRERTHSMAHGSTLLVGKADDRDASPATEQWYGSWRRHQEPAEGGIVAKPGRVGNGLLALCGPS